MTNSIFFIVSKWLAEKLNQQMQLKKAELIFSKKFLHYLFEIGMSRYLLPTKISKLAKKLINFI